MKVIGEQRFYIFSRERRRGECWRRADPGGYTYDLWNAGEYTLEEVGAILHDGDGDDIPIPVDLVDVIVVLIERAQWTQG